MFGGVKHSATPTYGVECNPYTRKIVKISSQKLYEVHLKFEKPPQITNFCPFNYFALVSICPLGTLSFALLNYLYFFIRPKKRARYRLSLNRTKCKKNSIFDVGKCCFHLYLTKFPVFYHDYSFYRLFCYVRTVACELTFLRST